MPWDALPEHLNSPEKWKGTDNDTWLMRWDLYIKGWFAFGPRAKEWWANWKFPPAEIFKIGGTGTWRYESIPVSPDDNAPYTFVLSRCQYFKRWSFVWVSPFCFTFHIYWRAKDVPLEKDAWKNDFNITKLFFAYGPIHWDADLIYWILSFYVGGQWK